MRSFQIMQIVLKASIMLVCIAYFPTIGLSPLGAESSSLKTPTDFDSQQNSQTDPAPTQPTSFIPFAKQEQALVNSERWKTMGLEERQEALAKIRHFRELYKKQQAELWNNYKPLIEKKRKKRGRLSKRHRTIAEKQFEGIWIQWQAKSRDRQTRLIKKWKIKKSLPSQRRKEFQKFWSKLLPAHKQKFMMDLR